MQAKISNVKSLVESVTKSVYRRMGINPKKRYTQSELMEAYGRYLMEAGEDEMPEEITPDQIVSDEPVAPPPPPAAAIKPAGALVGPDASGFYWLLKLDPEDGAFKYMGYGAQGDTKLVVAKGKIGYEDSEDRKFRALPKNAAKEAQKNAAWKVKKEGWHSVPALPTSEQEAYEEYGSHFGITSSYDDIENQRVDAELARREKVEADKLARKANRAPRGGTDEEGYSDRKLYGKRNGHPIHTGLSGVRYAPIDGEGKPFQSKFKPNQYAKTNWTDPSRKSVTVKGKIPSNPADKNSEPVDHTQIWNKMESKQRAQIEKMIIDQIFKSNKK